MRFILVNGINSNGDESVDLMGAELRRRGHSVVDVHQPIRHAIDVRSRKKRLRDMFDVVYAARDGDVLICHSYGCLKGALSMDYINYAGAYFFRPAMSRGYKFKPGKLKLTCVYSPCDIPIWLGWMLAFRHPFGLAGAKGLKDPRVKNIKSAWCGHSDDFRKGCGEWADYIEQDLGL